MDVRHHVMYSRALQAIALACTVVVLAVATAEGQNQVGSWSPPALVLAPEYGVGDDRALLLSDRSGRLHAFFSYAALDTSGNPLPEYPYNTILYTASDDGLVWTEPIDVLIPAAPKPWQGAGMSGAIDDLGNIHLIFSGTPNGGGGVLKYARSHVSTAANALAWQEPESGEWGMAVTGAALVLDAENSLHMIYSARPGNVYYRVSTDHGTTWSSDRPVVEIDPNFSAPDDVSLAIDGRGRLHVAWVENKPEGYPPIGVYYSFSDDDGQSWSPAIQLGGLYSTRVAMAVRAPDEVHAVWSTSLQDRGRYAAASYDGGVTWSQPELVARYDTGLSTYPEQVLMDSAGALYWILTGEEGDYLTMASPGNRWTPPVQLTFPPTPGWTKASLTSGTSCAIAAGNELHLIAREGPRPQQDEDDRYWHTMMALNAPRLPALSLPTPGLTPTAELAQRASAAPSPTPTRLAPPLVDFAPPASHSPALWASVLPAAILVLTIVGYQFMHRARK